MDGSRCDVHSFLNSEELQELRTGLLEWYRSNKRELPWRERAVRETDPNKRAYAVWVSEIMLQQTQVATVIDYYNRWMKKWPTVKHLAKATLEEVNSTWSGLGYYSRGQRLWEGARKVVSELGGDIPSTSDQLAKLLPGVGRYTAGAVASIAFGQCTGVVDGNVMRVFARHRLVGADITLQSTIHHFWELANGAVDPLCPGDFNQALMELGAVVCTPKSPKCGQCPIRGSCGAFAKIEDEVLLMPESLPQQQELLSEQTKLSATSEHQETRQEQGEGLSVATDVEDCPLCLSVWNKELGVMNFPCKAKKKPPSVQHFVTALIDWEGQLLLRQRPEKGLLAGLWEFPSLEVADPESSQQEYLDQLLTTLLTPHPARSLDSTYLGEIIHQFSHTHHHYHCWYVKVKGQCELAPPTEGGGQMKQVRKEEVTQCAIPTAVKKMLKLLNGASKRPPPRKRHRNPNTSPSHSSKRQKTIESFFKSS